MTLCMFSFVLFYFSDLVAARLKSKLGYMVVWGGDFGYHVDRCPSHVFQKHLGEICVTDSENSVQFVNGLLNQLNLVFSEVMSLVQAVMAITVFYSG